MIRLALILFMLMLSAPALAQRGSPPENKGAATERVLQQEEEDNSPRLTAIRDGCIQPGDVMTIEGDNLARNPNLLPKIKLSGEFIALDILSRSENRFVAKLPRREELQPDRIYRLVLTERDKESGSALSLRLCPQLAAPVKRPQNTDKEILIMADMAQEGAIRTWLADSNIQILESESLSALDSIIFVIAGDDLQVLRAQFPEAAIDWNDDLQPAKGPRLYARDKIGWPAQQDCLPEKGAMKIGLIDGAIYKTHSAFKGQTIISENFMGNHPPDPHHATAIASILIGNAPEEGFDGLLKGQPLYLAGVLRNTSDGQLAATKAIIVGLNWLVEEKVRLINASLATDKDNLVLKRGFDKALDRGALIFAAAGNNGPQAPPAYPAAYDRVIAVTAIDAAGRLYENANRGDYIDFAAPGVDIWVAGPRSGSYKSGTSYAVPYALATAALYLKKNPSVPRDVLIQLMQNLAQHNDNPWRTLKLVSDPCDRN